MARTVYVTRVIPQPGIDLLRKQAHVDVNESDNPLDQNELREKASKYDALVTLLTDRIDHQVLQAGKGSLKIVANVAVGYDNIDVTAATNSGILVSNTPGVLTDTTADFAFALLMGIARRLAEAQTFLRSGKYEGWGIMSMLGQDIHGATLGLVGFGRIGQAVAKRAAGFGMRVLYYDPVIEADSVPTELGATRVDLESLLRDSDFVSVHTPLSEETRHLIGQHEFEIMKPTACLINTSRGPVIHEAELATALRDGTIWGAALDVFENEPTVDPGLLDLDNVLITPHIASASVATRTRMATMAAENVLAVFSGQRPPTAINLEVLS
ncbi:MAG: D-glycerate dehydrogenase [Chloroflexota bacterium]